MSGLEGKCLYIQLSCILWDAVTTSGPNLCIRGTDDVSASGSALRGLDAVTPLCARRLRT